MKKQVFTNKAPQVIGSYSQAILANGFLFVSGQIPVNPETQEIEKNIENQTHQVMKNIFEILKCENLNFSDVLKTSIFLTDLSNFEIVNEIYASYFKDTIPPARETIEVSKLPKNVLIEISLIALKNK